MDFKYLTLLLPVLVIIGCDDDPAPAAGGGADPIIGTWTVAYNGNIDSVNGSCNGIIMMKHKLIPVNCIRNLIQIIQGHMVCVVLILYLLCLI